MATDQQILIAAAAAIAIVIVISNMPMGPPAPLPPSKDPKCEPIIKRMNLITANLTSDLAFTELGRREIQKKIVSFKEVLISLNAEQCLNVNNDICKVQKSVIENLIQSSPQNETLLRERLFDLDVAFKDYTNFCILGQKIPWALTLRDDLIYTKSENLKTIREILYAQGQDPVFYWNKSRELRDLWPKAFAEFSPLEVIGCTGLEETLNYIWKQVFTVPDIQTLWTLIAYKGKAYVNRCFQRENDLRIDCAPKARQVLRWAYFGSSNVLDLNETLELHNQLLTCKVKPSQEEVCTAMAKNLNEIIVDRGIKDIVKNANTALAYDPVVPLIRNLVGHYSSICIIEQRNPFSRVPNPISNNKKCDENTKKFLALIQNYVEKTWKGDNNRPYLSVEKSLNELDCFNKKESGCQLLRKEIDKGLKNIQISKQINGSVYVLGESIYEYVRACYAPPSEADLSAKQLLEKLSEVLNAAWNDDKPYGKEDTMRKALEEGNNIVTRINGLVDGNINANYCSSSYNVFRRDYEKYRTGSGVEELTAKVYLLILELRSLITYCNSKSF